MTWEQFFEPTRQVIGTALGVFLAFLGMEFLMNSGADDDEDEG